MRVLLSFPTETARAPKKLGDELNSNLIYIYPLIYTRANMGASSDEDAVADLTARLQGKDTRVPRNQA